ncbi:Ger(x)C family spore germination protein [Wukongibacter baidiensis]|uniref:Ger(x)C family spore germination protein n=1 Tax=Wukongibacter baidiensis TaxID=1723361 RepID=UPI003D7FFC99
MKPFKNIIVVMIIIYTAIFLPGCHGKHPIEELSIATGFGYDIEKGDEIKLVDPAEFLLIKKKDETGSVMLAGEGASISLIVENRRSKQSKTFTFGTEIVFIISEERAEFGTKDIIEDLLRTPEVNINAAIAICKGKSEDLFSLKAETDTISEQLFEMLKFSYEGNFYSKCNSINDFLVMYHQQGREVYLPYIEIINERPQLTGTAVFKDDKMIRRIPMKEAKLINILRDSDGKGYLSIQSDEPLEYLDLEGENKVKVKVSNKGDKLKYDILVTILADLRIDTLNDKEFTKEQLSKVEKLFEEKLQKDLNKVVKKVQEEYGVDCLDLGKYAIAKYGRDSGYDSQEHFSNADIQVHVKVKIKSTGKIHGSSVEDEL